MTQTQTQTQTHTLQPALEDLLDRAFAASADVGREVEAVLREGLQVELSREEAVSLLSRVIEILRRRLEQEPGESNNSDLEGKVSALIERAIEARDRMIRGSRKTLKRGIELVPHRGIEPREVSPTPTFHTRPIPMRCGFVRLDDIKLWDCNARLDIHLNQFQCLHGRKPMHEELAEILLGTLKLPGSTDGKSDVFHIRDLARSIAANGLQKPPILSFSGELLDGNRRVTACHYIRRSDEFELAEKRNIEWVFVWQLTEFATPDDEQAVVVALNFESDYKEPWPEYVKARRVWEAWQDMVVLAPGSAQAELKRQLAKKFALGPDVSRVTRYLKMMEWAIEFEEYLVAERHLDEIEVKHRTNEYFQYFDELAKGKNPGGVAFTLNQNESFKKLVFDLLYDGKIESFTLVRKLKYLDDDLWKSLSEARDETNRDRAEDLVERALNDAHSRNAETRVTGANPRIEAFVKFLMALPVGAFRDEITTQNLHLMLDALEYVKKNVQDGLAYREARGAHA